jgi:hypothetical protein
MSDNSQSTIAQAIAEQLGEVEAEPRAQIERTVEIHGTELAQTILQETLEIEANGGLLVPDGSRRRTPGGVFFSLLRQRISREEWRRIQQLTTHSPEIAAQTLPWAERAALVAQAAAHPGTVETVKLTIVGRPRDVKRHDTFVIVVLEDTQPIPALPSGVPAVTTLPTLYKIFIPLKRWRAMESALKNPDDVMVVEGYAYPHDKAQTVLVLAQLATTTKLQVAWRDHQKAKTRR